MRRSFNKAPGRSHNNGLTDGVANGSNRLVVALEGVSFKQALAQDCGGLRNATDPAGRAVVRIASLAQRRDAQHLPRIDLIRMGFLTSFESSPCLSSSFLSSSAGAALASLPPKIDAPVFLMKLIKPIPNLPYRRSSSQTPQWHAFRECDGGGEPNGRKIAQALFIDFMTMPTMAVTIAPDTPPPTSWPTSWATSMLPARAYPTLTRDRWVRRPLLGLKSCRDATSCD
jgi:hypothetical protein